MRLERFSYTRLEISRDGAEIEGTAHQRALAKLAVSMILQQRDGGAVNADFDALESRDDVSTFDVPCIFFWCHQHAVAVERDGCAHRGSHSWTAATANMLC